MKRWVVLGLALFSAINLQAQEKVYFLGDSCFLVDPIRNEKADGVWLKFDQRKDQMQKWIEDGLLVISLWRHLLTSGLNRDSGPIMTSRVD